jgi:hypothetical protein
MQPDIQNFGSTSFTALDMEWTKQGFIYKSVFSLSCMDIPRFVKWAGGKQQLIEQFKPVFPKRFDGYFEP